MTAYRPLCYQSTTAMHRIALQTFMGTIKNDISRPCAIRTIHSTSYPYQDGGAPTPLPSSASTTTASFAASPPTSPQHLAIKPRKRLDIALVGAPNAGKSQLLNSLIGSKVAAVSRKRHTTRTGILGARTFDNTQLVFIDTPGFLHHTTGAKEGVRKLLGVTAGEMQHADFTLLVVDAARRLEDDLKRTLITLMLLALRSRGRNEDGLRSFEMMNNTTSATMENAAHVNKFAVVLNKVDLVNPKEKLLLTTNEVGSMAESCIRRLLQQRRGPSKIALGELVDSILQNYTEEEGFDNVHEDDMATFASMAPEFLFTAAIDDDDEGVDDVLGLLLERATPSKEWIVDAESTTGMSPIEQVEEIIREKIYRCLHREVPHSVMQQNRMFRLIEPDMSKSDDASEGKLLRIHQELIVRTKSHQRLVLGSGGKTLERIRSTALRDLEEAFKCEVDLNIDVKVNTSNTDAILETEHEGATSFTI
ncbi:hypothetical protein ACHAXH_002743 [Discostella pseudostelligera]